jgi:hypothetical protein
MDSFNLTFIAERSEHPPYPHGYWYATALDDGYDGQGPTPEIALASLIGALVAALREAGA